MSLGSLDSHHDIEWEVGQILSFTFSRKKVEALRGSLTDLRISGFDTSKCIFKNNGQCENKTKPWDGFSVQGLL
jgi:tricorn protease-like protein